MSDELSRQGEHVSTYSYNSNDPESLRGVIERLRGEHQHAASQWQRERRALQQRAARAEARLVSVRALAAKWDVDADACDRAHEEWGGASLYVAKCLRQVAAELRERLGGA